MCNAVLEGAGTVGVITEVLIGIGGWHLMGAACMGGDPERSVVNEWGRIHDVRNLFIVDGSIFVTSAGVNPTLLRRLEDGILRARTELGVTFLIIEHDMGLVARLCDHVIVMSEGAVLTQGAPSDVQRDDRVVRAYLGG